VSPMNSEAAQDMHDDDAKHPHASPRVSSPTSFTFVEHALALAPTQAHARTSPFTQVGGPQSESRSVEYGVWSRRREHFAVSIYHPLRGLTGWYKETAKCSLPFPATS